VLNYEKNADANSKEAQQVMSYYDGSEGDDLRPLASASEQLHDL
jgi:hypothetical protein